LCLKGHIPEIIQLFFFKFQPLHLIDSQLLGLKYVSKLQSFMMWSQFFETQCMSVLLITNLFQSGNFFHCVCT